MTDSLRTRIAAALKAEAERRGIYWIADFDFPFMADAVIRELDLGIPCDRLPNEADSAAARRSHQQIGATNR